MPRKARNSDEPSTSRRRRIKSSSSDDNDDSEGDQQQSTTFRPSVTFAAPNPAADTATLTNNMVKYLLNYSATKIPIKRAEISKNLGISQKLFPEVFQACSTKLQEIYGLEVSEIQENKSSKVYIIHSSFNTGVMALQYAPDQRHEITLLFIILSYIFMKGGEIQEGKKISAARHV